MRIPRRLCAFPSPAVKSVLQLCHNLVRQLANGQVTNKIVGHLQKAAATIIVELDRNNMRHIDKNRMAVHCRQLNEFHCSLHRSINGRGRSPSVTTYVFQRSLQPARSEEHTSELQ